MLTVAIDSYITVREADEILRGESGHERWEALGDEERESRLRAAARHVDALYFAGRKHSVFQSMAFPRDLCREVPQAVKRAQALEALALTDERAVARRALREKGVASVSLGKASESYTARGVAELMSVEAFRLLRPFLLGSAVVV